MAGPFWYVSVFLTDRKQAKWVSTDIIGNASIVLLKYVGKPIVAVRIHVEEAVLLEYELPLNVMSGQLNERFTCLSCLDTEEYLGFHFESEAECTLFSSMITDLTERLANDTKGSHALKQVAKMYR